MIFLGRRAVGRFAVWNVTRVARAAHGNALYGDYRLARRLTDRAVPDGPALLAVIAAVWADAYLADIRGAEAEVVMSPGGWLGEVIAARASRDGGGLFELVADVPVPMLWHRFEALLRMAALARLALDDPDLTWP